MKRLLLVSQRPQEYGGGGSNRWRFFREALPDCGWQVSVVTARPNPTANEFSDDPVEARLNALRAAVMGRVGTLGRPVVNRLTGAQPEAFAPSALWAVTGRRAVRRAVADFRPDVVYATSPPPAAHFVTAGLRRELGVPLICELRDNWAGNPYYDADGRTLKRIEQRVLAPAAAVVVVTSAMASLMRALHPELADRLHVLPNGFDPRVLAFRESRRENTPGPLTLVHAGSIYGERTPEPVLAAMRRSPGRFRLVLAGAGSEMYGGAPDVEIRSAMPWEDAIKLQAAADIGVSLHSEDRTAQPGKLYELLALGKPILALVDEGNATHRLLESLGHGDGCVPHNDVDAIHAALTRLADDPPPPVLPERLEPWNRAAITKRLAALLDDVSK